MKIPAINFINIPFKTTKTHSTGLITNPFGINFTASTENSDRVELSEKAQFIRELENEFLP